MLFHYFFSFLTWSMIKPRSSHLSMLKSCFWGSSSTTIVFLLSGWWHPGNVITMCFEKVLCRYIMMFPKECATWLFTSESCFYHFLVSWFTSSVNSIRSWYKQIPWSFFYAEFAIPLFICFDCFDVDVIIGEFYFLLLELDCIWLSVKVLSMFNNIWLLLFCIPSFQDSINWKG